MPRVLVWDGEGAVGRWPPPQARIDAGLQGFRGTLGANVVICKPADPEAKGIIERNHAPETSFLPGRSFTGPDDFNRLLTAWLAVAKTRRQQVLGCAPADRIDADRHAMLTLPSGATGHRMAAVDPACPRSLHSPRLQRLLGAPVGDRPADRGHRRRTSQASP